VHTTAVREVKPRFRRGVWTRLLVAKGVPCQVGPGDSLRVRWPRERSGSAELTYEPAARPKPELYRDICCRPSNSRRVALLDHPSLVSRSSDERGTAWGGRDSIDHGDGQHETFYRVRGYYSHAPVNDGYNLEVLAS